VPPFRMVSEGYFLAAVFVDNDQAVFVTEDFILGRSASVGCLNVYCAGAGLQEGGLESGFEVGAGWEVEVEFWGGGWWRRFEDWGLAGFADQYNGGNDGTESERRWDLWRSCC
jgi:hypothetical protein